MAEVDEEGFAEESLVYLGVRVDGKGRRTHAWEVGGSEKLWDDTGEFVVGGMYTGRIKHEGGSTIRRGTPRYKGYKSETHDLARLDAMHHAARAALTAKRVENAAIKGPDELDELLEPIVEIMKKIRTGPERDYVIAYVLRKLYGAW